jgi:predicted enzyme related to lactoylglutathione lyase
MTLFKNCNVFYYYVTNWEAAKKFYDDVLGWPVAISSDELGWREYGRVNEAHVAISRWQGPAPMPAGLNGICTFTVEDVVAVTAALRAKGVKCDDPMVIPGIVALGTFFDPEGNRFQFAANVMSAA